MWLDSTIIMNRSIHILHGLDVIPLQLETIIVTSKIKGIFRYFSNFKIEIQRKLEGFQEIQTEKKLYFPKLGRVKWAYKGLDLHKLDK